MHAGVVNAGGYLMIRTSPLVAHTPSALTILALIGGFTACFAAVMMITQFSIKNKLAYSTIAQMGFMLLQCGLGAFSAAMLHIIAHSLYKAYAFLSSGSVMQHRAATLGAQSCSGNYFWLRLAMFATVPVLALASGYAWLGVNLAQKPGGMLLGSLLVLAFAHWITQVSFNQSTRKLLTALGASMLLCLVYVGCYALVDSLITASLPVIAKPALPTFVQACLLTGFVAVFGLSVHVVSAKPSAWSNRLYVHWSNGFYVESFLRRITVPGYRMFSGK
jgi:NAD(P)H-quinone oxidoreductase subunit 5